MSQTLHQAFLSQAQKTPDNICIVDNQISLTYQQVADRIMHLSVVLYQQGIKEGSIVGILCEKRYEIMIAFLAVSKLGASCLQLDKAFPETLLVDMLKETKADILLCDEDLHLEAADIKNLNIVDICDDEELLSDKSINVNVDPFSPLWLVYSSGTTGRNKGISISHHAILESYETRYKIKDYNDKSNVACNIYYLWEVFRPVLRGGTTHIVRDELLYDFEALANYLQHNEVEECLFTPSYLETLFYTSSEYADVILKHLDVCWLNGEVVSSSLYHKLQPYLEDTKVYNLYSISECHDVATYQLRRKDGFAEIEGVVPAGFLLDGVEAILLDDNGQICANDEKGELYIHSRGLAIEYINRPDLNAERFIEADKSPIGKRLYKTGDYAKLTNNGRLVSVYGRCDYIVKIRGYTVSLPFVEAILKDKFNMMHCVVEKKGNSLLDEHLVAYLEIPLEQQQSFYEKWGISKQTINSPKIVEYVSSFLAPYMRPQSFIILNKIDVNAYSNKLDRNSVESELDKLAQIKEIASVDDYRKLWGLLLGVPSDVISDNTSFFKLGGTSLSAMMLINTMSKFSKAKIKIAEFMLASSFAQSYALFNGVKPQTDKRAVFNEMQADVKQAFKEIKQSLENSNKVQTHATNTKKWLLTGATGFFGKQLLLNMLENTNDNIVCIIRANGTEHLQQRSADLVESLGVNQAGRVEFIQGDLSYENMGVASDKLQSLQNKITGIINVAADVNLMLPYSKIKHSSLNGVKNLVQLAFTGIKKEFYHISSNAVFASSTLKEFKEQKISAKDAMSYESGYSQVKWVAEEVLFLAQELGLNVNIFRPGNISADIENNLNTKDMNYMILQQISYHKAIPKGLSLEMTPISHVARCIVESTQNSQSNTVYNMTNKNLLDDKTLSEYTVLPILDREEWLSSLDEEFKMILSSDNYLDATSVMYQQQHYEKLMKRIASDYPELTKQAVQVML